MLPAKKSWREFNDERKKRKSDKVIKQLEKKIKLDAEIAEQPKQPLPSLATNTNKTVRTLSVAVPGSILDNAQSQELRTYLAGQIARSLCIYKVNEVIVFDDSGEKAENGTEDRAFNKSCTQFARLLQYLECPQYLRKHFFPVHKDLQFIGLLNPLDTPHHLRQSEECQYREGITTTKPTKSNNESYVNVGLPKDIKINQKLDPGLRVTVKLSKKRESKKTYGTVVSPEEPLKALSLYWGYSVRIAHSLSEVLTKSPYKSGYDVTIGTSDKGKKIDDLKKKELKNFEHVLIVFGGLKGLEVALENDEVLDVDNPSLLFDYYLNTCPEQGTRTIRTEEAILVTLAELRRFLKN